MSPLPYDNSFSSDKKREASNQQESYFRYYSITTSLTALLMSAVAEEPGSKRQAECGVPFTVGIDGEYVDRDTLLIDAQTFKACNLNERIDIPERFDLAMSLEVAEHLPYYRSGSFVADLVKLSDVILFSAALPYQGGTEHINEQWLEFWAILFRRHRYVPCDLLRRRIWGNPNVEYWYSQNLVLFCKEDLAPSLFPPETLVGDAPLSFTHPLTLLANVSRYRPLAVTAIDLEFQDYSSLLRAYLSGESILPPLQILSGKGEMEGSVTNLFPNARTEIVNARERFITQQEEIQKVSTGFGGSAGRN